MNISEHLNRLRGAFFASVVSEFPIAMRPRLLLLTHLLEDRPIFVEALAKCCDIEAIIAIPYSVDPVALSAIKSKYRVYELSLQEMLHGDQLLKIADETIFSSARPGAILEIGGYFARFGNSIKSRHGEKFLGCVEDTENGHRRYKDVKNPSFPVVSIARSNLKRIEDRLIGTSVVFSLERALRNMGQVIMGITIGVIGYGPIGMSVAISAHARGANVLVYDIQPDLRVRAIADGFRVPEREVLLHSADIIIGATGRQSISKLDFELLKDGALLASASSKQIEFDMEFLRGYDTGECATSVPIEKFRIGHKHIYVMANGEPVNFLDGAVVGPLINLVQAELIAALQTLTQAQKQTGLLAVSQEKQERLATLWLNHFVDLTKTGLPRPALAFHPPSHA